MEKIKNGVRMHLPHSAPGRRLAEPTHQSKKYCLGGPGPGLTQLEHYRPNYHHFRYPNPSLPVVQRPWQIPHSPNLRQSLLVYVVAYSRRMKGILYTRIGAVDMVESCRPKPVLRWAPLSHLVEIPAREKLGVVEGLVLQKRSRVVLILADMMAGESGGMVEMATDQQLKVRILSPAGMWIGPR